MMRNFWLVAKNEYSRLVRRRSFLFATLGVPLLIIAVMAVSIFLSTREQPDRRPLGYVDLAGVLAEPASRSMYADDNDPELRAFTDEESARAALTSGDIQAYYVVPADYTTSPRVQMRYWSKAPGDSASGMFTRFMRATLIARQAPGVQARLLRGINITTRTLRDGRETTGENVALLLFSVIIGMFFVFVVMGSAGYLLRAVTTEKENRTVEIMFTSLSPVQLIGGKALGLLGVSLTQIGLWVATLVVGLVVVSRYTDFIQGFAIPWQFPLLMALFFLPTYALVAGLMIIIGSMVTDLQQGQQISGVVNLLFIIPFFFLALVFTEPNSPLMVVLTLFPTTSFLMVAMRWGMTTIPLWQLAVGWVLVVLTALFSVWVAARVFRIGMLNYGQNLDLRKLAGIVKARGA